MTIFRADVARVQAELKANPARKEPTTVVPNTNLLREVWDQLRGPQGKGWPQLGGRTIVDSLAEAHRKLDELLGRSK